MNVTAYLIDLSMQLGWIKSLRLINLNRGISFTQTPLYVVISLDNLPVRLWCRHYCLLHEAIEEHALWSRRRTVKTEWVFIKVILKIFAAHWFLACIQRPALNQCGKIAADTSGVRRIRTRPRPFGRRVGLDTAPAGNTIAHGNHRAPLDKTVAPMWKYSVRRPCNPFWPSVICALRWPSMSFVPVSILISGMNPVSMLILTKGVSLFTPFY